MRVADFASAARSHGSMQRRSHRSTVWSVCSAIVFATSRQMPMVLPQPTSVRSWPTDSRRAVPMGTRWSAGSPVVDTERSFRHTLGYRKMVGRWLRKAAFSMPAASAAVLGIITSMPGMWASRLSWVCAWNGPRPGR